MATSPKVDRSSVTMVFYKFGGRKIDVGEGEIIKVSDEGGADSKQGNPKGPYVLQGRTEFETQISTY